MSKPFHFKKFFVAQTRCAMKVGTDGVLLGAWAKTNQKAVRILDVGTGSGVVALMMAQRFPEAEVVGLDIDAGAYEQALENFQQSPFSERLSVHHCALQCFDEVQRFDCIVSNPPFFMNGILPSNPQRELARHTSAFSFTMFFTKTNELLTEEGRLSVIVPLESAENLLDIAEKAGLYCQEYCIVFPNPQRPSKRVLLAFGKKKKTVEKSQLTIETEERHQYTEEYRQLLKDFYLAF